MTKHEQMINRIQWLSQMVEEVINSYNYVDARNGLAIIAQLKKPWASQTIDIMLRSARENIQMQGMTLASRRHYALRMEHSLRLIAR